MKKYVPPSQSEEKIAEHRREEGCRQASDCRGAVELYVESGR